MSKIDKLVARLLTEPKDFTFSELERLLRSFSYKCVDKGKTSGSRVAFISNNHGAILLHKPHGRKELLGYQIKQVIDILKKEGLI